MSCEGVCESERWIEREKERWKEREREGETDRQREREGVKLDLSSRVSGHESE